MTSELEWRRVELEIAAMKARIHREFDLLILRDGAKAAEEIIESNRRRKLTDLGLSHVEDRLP